MPTKSAVHRPLRAKLIFNEIAGQLAESPQQLTEILTEMQIHNILPEVYMIRPDSRVDEVVRSAIKSGIRLIIVAGGDGTIETVAEAMVGGPASLGIIPTGTRNNLALNLGIPAGIPEAVAILRKGVRLKIDVGQVRRGRATHWFLEVAALGLLSDLYPVTDDIQHGNLGQIGNLVSTIASATPSRLRLTLDGRRIPDTSAHMVLISNMAYIGPNFQISPRVSCVDGLLDVFLFTDMGKLELILSLASQAANNTVKDPNIMHYRVRELTISSKPPMPVLADSFPVGQGDATIRIHRRALIVMAGPATRRKRARPRPRKSQVAPRA